MKKKSIIIIIALFIKFPISAHLNYNINTDITYNLITNVFSSPLPSYEAPDDEGQLHWLPYKYENPLTTKHCMGLNIGMDMFFKEDAEVGLSTSLQIYFTLKGQKIQPVPDNILGQNLNDAFKGPWHYQYTSLSANKVPAVFFSVGPIFTKNLNYVDLGVSFRISIGGFDYTYNEVILGVQVEPYVSIQLSEYISLCTKINLDSHLIRFINKDNLIYDPHYLQISLSPSLGLNIHL